MNKPPMVDICLSVIRAHHDAACDGDFVIRWNALGNNLEDVPAQELTRAAGRYHRLAAAHAPVIAGALLDAMSEVAELRAHVRLVSKDQAMQAGSWVSAADVYRTARQLDVAWNGEDGAADAPVLVDVASQIRMEIPALREDAKQGDHLLRALIDALPADVVERDDALSKAVYRADAFLKRHEPTARDWQSSLSETDILVLDEVAAMTAADDD